MVYVSPKIGIPYYEYYINFESLLISAENSVFTNREFSFTLQDDVYIRYLSFENQKDLENEICDRNPFKIDIGAVMNVRPKDHRASSVIRPVQRELVFDIDMTDYDEVRTCCSEAKVCVKCWKFMTIACRIIDLALREDFGFEHILWVFSGRRGLHCWVCDKTARHLNTAGRVAISEYLQLVVSGGEESVSKVKIGETMHHSVRRAYSIIEPLFNEICIEDQNMFGTPAKITKLLQMIPDDNNIRKILADKFKDVAGDSKAVWRILTEYMQSLRRNGNNDSKFKNITEEIQLALMYPRLDINVSKGFNHLLKSPFCIHPKTGKICVPFNPDLASKFDPTTVPTIK